MKRLMKTILTIAVLMAGMPLFAESTITDEVVKQRFLLNGLVGIA